MDRHARFRVLLLLASVFVSREAAIATEPLTASTIRWQYDLHAAHRESLRTNRPVLIVFGAEWCHFCTKLENESLGHPQVAAYVNQNFVPLHLNFDASEREAEILGVTAIPCVVALTPQAELVGRLDGFAAPQKVADMLGQAATLQAKIQQARYEQTVLRPVSAAPRR